jgi:hypothetical protein
MSRPPRQRAGVLCFAFLIPILGTVGLGGCNPTSDTESAKPVSMVITERVGQVRPRGETVLAHKGQDISVTVSSDRADRFQVRSVPVHEVDVAAGRRTTVTFSIETPGTYDVVSRNLGVPVASLEVR